MSNKLSSSLTQTDITLLKLDYLFAKQQMQEYATVPVERTEPSDDPRAAGFKVEDSPRQEQMKEGPVGKVQTKIYELVHRGGRTFERARTAWVNPEVATRLNQRKIATDWIRTLGNYIPIYFVGGYIRDKFFKKVSKDVDIIALTSLEQVKQILDNLGIAYKEKSNEFARLVFHVGDLKVDLISTTSDGLLENLGQRDFTINAIAQSVTGQFYDPYHGLDDIKGKVLRSPGNRSKEAFQSDPSRILRGTRFLAELPIQPHPSLLAALAETVDEVAKVKSRRVGFEIVKILKADKPWKGLQFLSSHGILQHVSPSLNSLIGLRQKGRRQDVWHHTLSALRRAKTTDLVLNLALLYHDVGKGSVEKVGGYFPKHTKASMSIAQKDLIRLGIPKFIIDRVIRLIKHHQFVGEAIKNPDPDEDRKLVLELRGDLRIFFEMSRADAQAAGYAAADVNKIEKRVKKVKSALPDETGAGDETELEKLDEVPKQESNSDMLLKTNNGKLSLKVEKSLLVEQLNELLLLSDSEILEVEQIIALINEKH